MWHVQIVACYIFYELLRDSGKTKKLFTSSYSVIAYDEKIVVFLQCVFVSNVKQDSKPGRVTLLHYS